MTQITIDRALVEQALKALEDLQPIIGNGLLLKIQLAFIDPNLDVAITALRAALAQQADKPQRPKCLEFALDFLGAPENGELLAYIEQLEARAEPVQEPFGYLWPTGMHPEFRFSQQKRDGVDGMPLYTAPPQRQPLTDEEIYDMYNEPRSDAEMVAFARAVEAAHGIKE